MANKRYYWLRLFDDFFTSKRIKKLRSIAGGDTYTIIYLKMQLKALKDDGYLYYDGIMDSFEEELALDLDENVEDVKITIQYLMSVGLIECSEDSRKFYLSYMENLIGSETASTQRSRESRLRKKEQKVLQCNTSATQVQHLCNVEKEKEKEKETRDRDKRQEKETKIDYQQIVDMYNNTCVSFPRVKTLSEARKKSIKARLKTYSVDDFKEMFEKAESSSFLKGGNGRDWSATFDWMLKDSNMAKVLDGNYDDKEKKEDNSLDDTDKELYKMITGRDYDGE